METQHIRKISLYTTLLIIISIFILICSGCTNNSVTTENKTAEEIKQSAEIETDNIDDVTISNEIIGEENEKFKDDSNSLEVNDSEDKQTLQEVDNVIEEKEIEEVEDKVIQSETVVSFKEVDENLYVNIDSLNVRSGPGTEYDKITSIELNTKVHRIGVGNNGWSKIEYNGHDAYVFSDYLSYEKTVLDTNLNKIEPKPEITPAPTPEIEAETDAGTKPEIEAESEAIVVEPEVVYTEVDEYLYVSSSTLNIRTGPGTEYSKIATVSLNTKLHRIGVGDNGWSKIEYDGQDAYVYSDYLSYEEIDPVTEEIARRGNIGHLTIPAVGIDVALFESSCTSGRKSQNIVDAYDSAVFISDIAYYHGSPIIGDHRHQGFEAMKNSVPGSTYAYIDFGTYTQSYVCVQNFIGYNTNYGLSYLDGSDIWHEGGLIMYTCNYDDTITITYWSLA